MWSKWQCGIKDTFFPVVTFKPCLVKSSQCSKWKGQLCWVNEEKNDLTKRQRSATNHVPISWQLSVVLLWFINKCTDFCSFPTLDRVNKKQKKQKTESLGKQVFWWFSKWFCSSSVERRREKEERKRRRQGNNCIILSPTSVQCAVSHPNLRVLVLSAKRPAGMSNLLGRIGGKKQKMSTLEKSKMDWDAFKSEEGITEELAIHNRGREGWETRGRSLIYLYIYICYMLEIVG